MFALLLFIYFIFILYKQSWDKLQDKRWVTRDVDRLVLVGFLFDSHSGGDSVLVFEVVDFDDALWVFYYDVFQSDLEVGDDFVELFGGGYFMVELFYFKVELLAESFDV